MLMELRRLSILLWFLWLLWLLIILSACGSRPSLPGAVYPSPVANQPQYSAGLKQNVLQFSYRVVKAYPHDVKAFTEGLVFAGGNLYESTGEYGQSSLRQVNIETGNIIRQYNLPGQYFGEGITVWQDTIIQLTWQSDTGFIYNKHNFALLGRFTYPMEGWGLTQDGSNLILSDGTPTIYFVDPGSFDIKRRITIHDSQGPVASINELEYINGFIFANIWKSPEIAIISPLTGQIMGWINLQGLLQTQVNIPNPEVLNGIAWDESTGRLFVTGKLWPYLFEIALVSLP